MPSEIDRSMQNPDEPKHTLEECRLVSPRFERTEHRLLIDSLPLVDKFSPVTRKWAQRGVGALIALAAYEANFDFGTMKDVVDAVVTRTAAFYAGAFIVGQSLQTHYENPQDTSIDNRGDL